MIFARMTSVGIHMSGLQAVLQAVLLSGVAPHLKNQNDKINQSNNTF